VAAYCVQFISAHETALAAHGLEFDYFWMNLNAT